jgi:hypothetical protein
VAVKPTPKSTFPGKHREPNGVDLHVATVLAVQFLHPAAATATAAATAAAASTHRCGPHIVGHQPVDGGNICCRPLAANRGLRRTNPSLLGAAGERVHDVDRIQKFGCSARAEPREGSTRVRCALVRHCSVCPSIRSSDAPTNVLSSTVRYYSYALHAPTSDSTHTHTHAVESS